MKKFLWIPVILVVVGYFINSNLEEKATREAEKAVAAKIEAAVSQMVARTDAIDDWQSRLSGGVLTIELERLLVQPRPILFRGAIKDIFTVDLSSYTVLIESSLFSGRLQLSLISRKEIVDSFLEKHPDLFGNFGWNNGVAVVARVHSIRPPIRPRAVMYHYDDEYDYGDYDEYYYDYEDYDEVKIGDGELIDIVYLGCSPDLLVC